MAVNKYKVRTVIEFGSGISSLLFDNMNMKVVSLETDEKYMNWVAGFCSDNISFYHWDNDKLPKGIPHTYDMALVDGCLPRRPQLDHAKIMTDLICIDDFAGSIRGQFTPVMAEWDRIDKLGTFMAVFRNN